MVLQVSNEGLRFDLNLPRGMTPEEISKVEALVNQWIEVLIHPQGLQSAPMHFLLLPTTRSREPLNPCRGIRQISTRPNRISIVSFEISLPAQPEHTNPKTISTE